MVLPQIFKLEENLYEEFENALDKINVGSTFVTVCGSTKTRKITDEFIKNVKRYKLLDPIEVDKPTVYSAFKIRMAAEKANASIIGFGGGKVMDVTKLGGSDARKAVILVPTQPTHDGMVSNVVSINQYGKPYSILVNSPTAVILPMSLYYQAPPEVIIRGVGDSFAKISANLDWKLSQELKNGKQKDPSYNENISYLCVKSTMKIIEETIKMKEENTFSFQNPYYKQFVSDLVEALISYGNSMCTIGSSVCASGSEHLFGHGLDVVLRERAPPHGISVGGIGLINALELYRNFRPDFYDKFFRDFGFKPLDLEDLKELESYLKIPYRIKELGIKEEEAISAYMKAVEIGDERGRITIYDYLRFYQEPKIEINAEFTKKYLTQFGII